MRAPTRDERGESLKMDRIECVIVGAGVVGLAVARRLALAGREVLVLEREGAIGTITSSRNSEVIHAGIYYPHDSLMARFCVAGRKLLYAYCADHGVPHRNCGKLIVATSDAESEKLAAIRQHAAQNGVDDLRMINAAEARALEPAVQCTAALLSPSTGIIDSHGYMLALRGDAEAAGASIAFNAPLMRANIAADGFVLDIGGHDPLTSAARC
jgi:L-2-hydroxyglutarate oxidase LhgO